MRTDVLAELQACACTAWRRRGRNWKPRAMGWGCKPRAGCSNTCCGPSRWSATCASVAHQLKSAVSRCTAIWRALTSRAQPWTSPWSQLADLSFTDQAHNVVLIGGPGTGKTHLAIALGVAGITQQGRRVRFYSTVDLVNALEQEKAQGKAGRLAASLVNMDLVILDELGYLPFSPFHYTQVFSFI